MPTKEKHIKVVNADDENPIPTEIIAESIVEISKLGRAINASRLRRRLIQLLIKDTTGVSFEDTNKILDALPKLEDLYLHPKK